MLCSCERCNKKIPSRKAYSIKITSGGAFSMNSKRDDSIVEFKLCKTCFKGFANFTDRWCAKKEETE
jgi:hypothetical protein